MKAFLYTLLRGRSKNWRKMRILGLKKRRCRKLCKDKKRVGKKRKVEWENNNNAVKGTKVFAFALFLSLFQWSKSINLAYFIIYEYDMIESSLTPKHSSSSSSLKSSEISSSTQDYPHEQNTSIKKFHFHERRKRTKW
jgi:uncharacterized membrane protein YbhN (UPF0104 family)